MEVAVEAGKPREVLNIPIISRIPFAGRSYIFSLQASPPNILGLLTCPSGRPEAPRLKSHRPLK
jgi:hypothetical protein